MLKVTGTPEFLNSEDVRVWITDLRNTRAFLPPDVAVGAVGKLKLELKLNRSLIDSRVSEEPNAYSNKPGMT